MTQPGNCWLFDIDGTMANNDHRKHHLEKDPKDWGAFFAASHLDPPHEHITKLVRSLRSGHHGSVIYATGRSEADRATTTDWVREHAGHVWRPGRQRLYMRADGDHRPDTVVKLELLKMMRNDGWEPIMCFDDRSSVVEMWRAAGIPCAQVALGDF